VGGGGWEDEVVWVLCLGGGGSMCVFWLVVFFNKVPCPVCIAFCSSCSGSAGHEK